MAKLDQSVVDAVQAADYTAPEDYVNFREAVPQGTYFLRLLDVRTTRDGVPMVGQSSGIPYWQAIFEHVGDRWEKKRHYFTLSHSPKAAPIMRMFYEAFESSSAVDTDELVGGVVKAQISTRIQQQGAGKGNKTNEIDRLDPATSAELNKLGELPEMDYVNKEAGWDDEEPDEDAPF